MFCWRIEWVQPFESAWSIFEKFKYANQVNSIELLREFGTEQVKKIKTSLNGSEIRDLYKMGGFDENLLSWAFKFNVVEHNIRSLDTIVSVLKRKYYGYNKFFHETFVYCPMCMKEGHHSLFHQFRLLQTCPFHMCELIYTCPQCKDQMPYMLWRDKKLKPYMCKCGHLLFGTSGDWVILWTSQRTIKDSLVLEWLNHLSQGRRLYFFEDKIIGDSKGIDMAVGVLKYTQKVSVPTGKSIVLVRQVSKRHNPDYEGWKFNDELYTLVLDIFKSIDKHLRRLMFKHKYCLHKTRKYFYNHHVEKKCESSIAYMTWRNTLLTTDKQYWKYVRLGAHPREFNHELVFPLHTIHHQLEHFVGYWKMNKEIKIDKDAKAFKWILAKIVGALLIAYWRVCQEAVIENRTNKNALERDTLCKAFLNQAPCIFVNFSTTSSDECYTNQYFEFNCSSILLNEILLCK